MDTAIYRFGNITTMEWWDNLYLNEGEHARLCPSQIADGRLNAISRIRYPGK